MVVGCMPMAVCNSYYLVRRSVDAKDKVYIIESKEARQPRLVIRERHLMWMDKTRQPRLLHIGQDRRTGSF